MKTPKLCFWNGTTIDAITDVRDTIVITMPGGGGAAPDPASCDPGGIFESEQGDNQIVPGAILEMRHYLDCPHPGNIVTATERGQWNTVAITGGVITAVNGGIDDNDHSYQVEIYEKDIECWPSDWVEWEVGDWVFVLAIVENAEDAVTLNNKGNLEPAMLINPRIMPLEIGDHGAGGLTFTPYDLGDISYTPMSLRTVPARILAKNEDNTVDIETSQWPLVQGVALKWHCPGTADYTGAADAYEIEDMVNFVIPAVAYDEHLDAPATPPAGAVMGWVDQELKACFPHLYYMGDPVECRDVDGNVIDYGDCGDDETYKSYRKFDILKNLSNKVEISNERQTDLTLNSIFMPTADNEKAGHGSYIRTRSDSIMLDRWTAHAVAWMVLNPGGNPYFYWAVTVDYNGAQWKFDKPLSLPAEFVATWPDDTPYSDKINTSEGNPEQGKYKPAHAFDLFALEADLAGTDWVEGDVILSVCGNHVKVEYWNLTQNDYLFRYTDLDGIILEDFPIGSEDILWQEFHSPVVLGVKGFDAYFTFGYIPGGNMESFGDAYKYTYADDATTALGIAYGHGILFNQFTRELWSINHGEVSEGTVPDPTPLYDFVPADGNTPIGGYPNPANMTCVSIYARYLATEAYTLLGYGPSGSGQNNRWKGRVDGLEYEGYYGTAHIGWRAAAGLIQTRAGGTTGPIEPCPQTRYKTGLTVGAPGWSMYADYVDDVDKMQYASITPDGTGEKRILSVQNGISDAPITGVDTDFVDGQFDEDYATDEWPHMAPYAWIKHALDSDGVEYEDIVIQQDNDGDNGYGETDEGIFFAVNANYAPEND